MEGWQDGKGAGGLEMAGLEGEGAPPLAPARVHGRAGLESLYRHRTGSPLSNTTNTLSLHNR